MVSAFDPDIFIKVLINLILITAAIIILKRDIVSLVSTYSIQSIFLAIIALLLYVEERNIMLIYIALLTIASKVIIIPRFMNHIQRKLNIKRDIEYHYLTPKESIILCVVIIMAVYVFLSRILGELALDKTVFFGATVGVSLTFMGMVAIFSRKQTITDIIGYLTMENGVLLFSLFLIKLPLIIEVLIIIDVIILTLLATMLAFGIDSTIEEFHTKLHPFKNDRMTRPKQTSVKYRQYRKPAGVE